MMSRTKDALKTSIATHAQTLSILHDQAVRESVAPSDGTHIATALYALTLQVAELAEATWATRQTLERMAEAAKGVVAASVSPTESTDA